MSTPYQLAVLAFSSLDILPASAHNVARSLKSYASFVVLRYNAKNAIKLFGSAELSIAVLKQEGINE